MNVQPVERANPKLELARQERARRRPRLSAEWLLDGLGVNFYFGGTSLLIVVGVAMDTVNQIEAQLIMRHYEGFTPRAGRIRGRRTGA